MVRSDERPRSAPAWSRWGRRHAGPAYHPPVAFPPGPDAIPATDARAATERLLAQPRVARRDLAMALAATDATSVDPLLHGRRYFPRMLADIAAATDSIHLLIYGYKPGEIGTTFLEALARRWPRGSRSASRSTRSAARSTWAAGPVPRPARRGISIVANDGILPDRDGPLGERRFDWRLDDFGHFDHRKMMVVDGRSAYVGGSGIEDHYNDERFYDVMCRVTGPIVAQLQLAFFARWRYQGGPLPDPPARCRTSPPMSSTSRPTPRPPDDRPAERPGRGHHPISDAIEQSLDEAQPSSTSSTRTSPTGRSSNASSRRPSAGSRPGSWRPASRRRPIPRRPSATTTSACSARARRSCSIPHMAHAKVLRIDDRVFIGGCNLDDLSLFRNDELDLLFEGPEVVELTERQVFDELVAMSIPATIPTGRREKVWNATMDRISRFL